MSSNERTAFPAIPAILGLDPTRERPRAANPMSSNGRTEFPAIPAIPVILGLGKLASKTSVQESPLHVVPEQVAVRNVEPPGVRSRGRGGFPLDAGFFAPARRTSLGYLLLLRRFS